MEIYQDFKELLELLNEKNVEYLIVGGYALAFHGAPRFTGDIDIFIKPTKKNAQRILMALEEFGFASLKYDIEDFTKKDRIIQLGVPPARIDIITSISGVSWDKAYSGRVKGDYGDVSVYYIGREQLIKNKRAVGRSKDIADIEALEEG
jgi:hypothetical protein